MKNSKQKTHKSLSVLVQDLEMEFLQADITNILGNDDLARIASKRLMNMGGRDPKAKAGRRRQFTK